MPIKRKPPFIKDEAPNFILPSDGETLTIECGGAHVQGPRGRDLQPAPWAPAPAEVQALQLLPPAATVPSPRA